MPPSGSSAHVRLDRVHFLLVLGLFPSMHPVHEQSASWPCTVLMPWFCTLPLCNLVFAPCSAQSPSSCIVLFLHRHHALCSPTLCPAQLSITVVCAAQSNTLCNHRAQVWFCAASKSGFVVLRACRRPMLLLPLVFLSIVDGCYVSRQHFLSAISLLVISFPVGVV